MHTHIVHGRDSGRGKEIQKLGQRWMPCAILDTRTVGSTALVYSIPPSTFHPSTLFKHGGKSLNGWYEVSSVTVCPYAFVNANRGEILLHWKFSRGISRLPGTNFEKPSCNIYPIKLSCTFSASCSQSPKSEGQTASAVVLFARTLRF